MSVEHADVLDEIEHLRGQLKGLESAVVSGKQTPSAIKVKRLGGSLINYNARVI